MPSSDIIVVILIIAGAFFGQSLFGFGGGLLAVPLISLLVPVRDAVTLVLVFQTCMGILVFSTRRETPWRTVIPLVIGIIAGVPAGIFLLSILGDNILRITIALFIFAYLGREIFLKGTEAQVEAGTLRSGATGFTGGVVQGMLGTGGPVFVMFLTSALTRKSRIRAAIISVLFISNLIRMAVSIPAGMFSQDLLRMILLAAGPFFVAVIAGHKLHGRLSETAYRRCIHLMLFVSGFSLIIKAL